MAGEISILLVSELDTCFSSVASCSAEMGKVLFVHVVLWMVPWFWVSPSMGKEPYTWRRPVPGWRQSEESVTLENRGYHFEEAEFEAHFRDQGKRGPVVALVIDSVKIFLSLLSGRAVCGRVGVCTSGSETRSGKGNWEGEGSV